MRRSALAGLGIARLANFHIHDDLQAGRLVPVLQAYDSGETEAIHAVFIGPGQQLPHRVRVFIDFLLDKVSAQLANGRV
jgi:DNA-binding transcriptional LysR family regulator